MSDAYYDFTAMLYQDQYQDQNTWRYEQEPLKALPSDTTVTLEGNANTLNSTPENDNTLNEYYFDNNDAGFAKNANMDVEYANIVYDTVNDGTENTYFVNNGAEYANNWNMNNTQATSIGTNLYHEPPNNNKAVFYNFNNAANQVNNEYHEKNEAPKVDKKRSRKRNREELPEQMTKHKRTRISFTEQQLSALEAEYGLGHYISRERRAEFAAKHNFPQAVVKVWFQNRRMRYKNQNQNQNQIKMQRSGIEVEKFKPNTFAYKPKLPPKCETAQKLLNHMVVKKRPIAPIVNFTHNNKVKLSATPSTATKPQIQMYQRPIEKVVPQNEAQLSPRNDKHDGARQAIQNIMNDLQNGFMPAPAATLNPYVQINQSTVVHYAAQNIHQNVLLDDVLEVINKSGFLAEEAIPTAVTNSYVQISQPTIGTFAPQSRSQIPPPNVEVVNTSRVTKNGTLKNEVKFIFQQRDASKPLLNQHTAETVIPQPPAPNFEVTKKGTLEPYFNVLNYYPNTENNHIPDSDYDSDGPKDAWNPWNNQ